MAEFGALYEIESQHATTLDRRAPRGPVLPGLAGVSQHVSEQVREAGLEFGKGHADFTAMLLAALATKPFVILSGLSGSGKTRFATALGQCFGRDQLLLQPVRPDWTSPEAVLGFENTASDTIDSHHAWNVPRTLEFALKAARDPELPYLLVLDEMNLAHVEQYFADVLSGIESRLPVIPNLRHDGRGWRIPPKDAPYIPWPRNLFVIGTINVDETTYRFSPKVLDRATTIEFRVPPGALKTEYHKERVVRRCEIELQHVFLQRALDVDPEWRDRNHLAHSLQHLHRELYDFDAEFGHRVFRESLRFAAMLADCGYDDHRRALDAVVLYKVLPKIESPLVISSHLIHMLSGFALYGPGRSQSVDPLNQVDTKPQLPQTFAKLRRIARQLSR